MSSREQRTGRAPTPCRCDRQSHSRERTHSSSGSRGGRPRASRRPASQSCSTPEGRPVSRDLRGVSRACSLVNASPNNSNGNRCRGRDVGGCNPSAACRRRPIDRSAENRISVTSRCPRCSAAASRWSPGSSIQGRRELVVGPEHDVVGEELGAPLEEIRERPWRPASVSNSYSYRPNPGQLQAPALISAFCPRAPPRAWPVRSRRGLPLCAVPIL